MERAESGEHQLDTVQLQLEEAHSSLAEHGVLQCVAVCCSVLQCAAVCCSALQCVVVCCVFFC